MPKAVQKNESAQIKFSVIIPSYNEGEDVRLSIESAVNQTYKPAEILVVDDSSDDTPNIIKEYVGQGVQLVLGPKKGCCEARNLGMQRAKGDVVVLLNADVFLPADFLGRIREHYSKGADYVLVQSKVFNLDSAWSRFVEAQHLYEYGGLDERLEWTEGFSCRRDAAEKVGYIPGNFPIKFCRDWMLGKKLGQAGYKKIVDLSIVVPHKAPADFQEYWRVRKARGRFGSLMQYYLLRRNLGYLVIKFVLKDVLTALKFLTIIPVFYKSFRVSRYSASGLSDLFPFFGAYLVQETARVVGEWEGLELAFKNRFS